MQVNTKGIHHITAIVGPPQENIEFYGEVLGLRLVKTTVNFDDPGTYHLYFGDETGKPGSIMTFFPIPVNERPIPGSRQVETTIFQVPPAALPFWASRLENYGVSYEEKERFGSKYLQFQDPHGLKLEMVEDKRGEAFESGTGAITPDEAIKGFYGAVLHSADHEATGRVLTELLGFSYEGSEGSIHRYTVGSGLGHTIDVMEAEAPAGEMGAGIHHHIAFRASSHQEHEVWKKKILNYGIHATDIKDRQYFKSIYFREPGGILFEIATDPPGFMIDESKEELGSNLRLPDWLEPHREQISDQLPIIGSRR
ncbi:glyoxalase family protein [Salsuginibacillus halophilus]|uniref:Glyoxalase family protein n=1 Tax=Salsuginibacillus halophilus TaxID=517424 RepID=A0A2P8HBG0_9BACI|nr:ring-cleaving dioxygenase [Salsuginibacillus halophilus]PSL43563.1 glyoxalase family protein [Salsuginibacillus halophilus]